MAKQIIFILIVFTAYINSVDAHNKTKKDTINYLFDTLSVAAKDRMIKVEKEAPDERYYTIQCPCLENNAQPAFRTNMQLKSKELNRDDIDQLKLISLADLIRLIKKSKAEDLTKKYIIFFIEPSVTGYNQRQVHYVKPQSSIIDGDVVHH